MHCVELTDHDRYVCKVLCRQLFALFRRVFFVLHSIAKCFILVYILEDHIEFVLFLTSDRDRWWLFRHATPVRYIRLK